MFLNIKLFDLFCLCCAFISTCRCAHFMDLGNQNWFVKNNKLNISIAARIPVSVHSVLLENGFIKDPLVGYRDSEYSWIADEQWIFQTEIKVPIHLNHSQMIFFTFHGLDTVSNIYLNDVMVGRSDNMFVTYKFHVKDVIKDNNILRIEFTSPTQYSAVKRKEYTENFGYEVPPVNVPEVQHGRDHVNFIRKQQCSFSWDWGPSFPTIGIWRDVSLTFDNFTVIEQVMVHLTYHPEQHNWRLVFEAITESGYSQEVLISYGFMHFKRQQLARIEKGEQKLILNYIEVPDEHINRWWPRGHGKQDMYTGFVRIINTISSDFSHKDVRFGFRTLELVQDAMEQGGMSFYFKVNGRAIFLKGANWIPADSFQERVTEEVLVDLIQSCVEANFNALRVWGGGVYEQDLFYKLADENGILIWQDLMFAVAMYPVNDEFLSSVQREVTTQIRRLQHHPSIIAWSGNNENEAAIAQDWWPEIKKNKDQLSKDYLKLYVVTISVTVENEDHLRPFLMSSPSNGEYSRQEGFLSKNPQNPKYGDVHFYDYRNDCMNISIFPDARFASEYGYQSYPSFKLLMEVANSSQLMWNSSFMYYRQHHKNGNREIEGFIRRQFNLPTSTNEQYLDDMTYLSQAVQAICTRIETEHYRRVSMGALYWQLNDVWQAPSWSSIEYGGRWKMLHYHALEFFAPTAVSGYVADGSVTTHVVTDHPHQSETYTLYVAVFTWKDFQSYNEQRISVRANQVSVSVYSRLIKEVCPADACVVEFQLFSASTRLLASETHVNTAPFKNVTLQDPKLKVSSFFIEGISSIRFTVDASAPAAFVWLSTNIKGRFSANGFTMTRPHTDVTFYSTAPIDVPSLKKDLTVRSLYQLYI